MATQKSKITDPESWQDTKDTPESWTPTVEPLGDIQREVLDELATKKFGVVISPIFKTASGGERIQINKGAMKAYDDDNDIVWQLLQNTNDNILTLNKGDSDGYGNAINIQDDSDDSNASLNIEFTGNSATKDLIHLELMSTMTQARVGQSIELEGGTVDSLYSGHAKAGTLSTSVGYFENDTDSGRAVYGWNDSADNADTAFFFRVDKAVSTNFYKVGQLSGAAAVQPTIWVCNGNDPNGTLTGTSGDICFGTDGAGNGLLKVCTSGTTWV